MVWRDTGLPWVPSSPHVPNGDSPLFQVATGVLGELGGLSTGIGYTLPFQCIAAPDLDPQQTASVLNAYKLPGIKFKPITYKPYYFTFKDQVIGGAQIFLTDAAHAPLTALNFYAIEAVKKLSGRDLFEEAAQARKSFSMFDKVNGTDATRKAMQEGNSAANVIASWKSAEDAFRAKRKRYLLY
jgi:uncharacterized protein YbbC (DUF1343 family)